MKYEHYYAEGAFHKATGQDWLPVFSPTTGEEIASVRSSSVADLDFAVKCAVAGFARWSLSTLDERRAVLRRLHSALASRTGAIARLLAQEMGCPVWLGELMQVPMALRGLELAIDALDQIVWSESVGNGVVEKVPVGVVAAITPWNFPLHQIVAKVAAAIAAGCTVVLKPSELAPGAAQAFVETCHEADLPAGVVNSVWGDAAIGQALVTHPEIDQVSFTGSTGVGRAIMADASKHLKRVTLELGGKSAAVILDDADLDVALPVVMRMAIANSGQACVSQSRLIVPAQQLRDVENRLKGLIQAWPLGDPLDAATRLGPLANARQFERVSAMVATAKTQGARDVSPEPGARDLPAKGYFHPVTLLSDVRPEMEIAQEEAFGPVLAIMPYDTEDEALAIANSTKYGLSGAVWSASKERATAFARRLKTGQVIINGAPQNLATPFGGRGESGIGRENGRYGVEECLTYRSLHGAV
ncbi:aldehyde dehydrogenase family protein [Cupriavidus sp. L7L]|uniref:aldehyde dehydrogenase family protein n=1 Tax=Cupriavidus sp. L7L TaxID=2546443 RepID=UPI001056BF0B|nr:aldehyde dehydrogenase family protein [Cupriavidus sp. L7L]TDF62676.1 aldehyde dehydrogenase family protein [Cupriavidus sp. L7L]